MKEKGKRVYLLLEKSGADNVLVREVLWDRAQLRTRVERVRMASSTYLQLRASRAYTTLRL